MPARLQMITIHERRLASTTDTNNLTKAEMHVVARPVVSRHPLPSTEFSPTPGFIHEYSLALPQTREYNVGPHIRVTPIILLSCKSDGIARFGYSDGPSTPSECRSPRHLMCAMMF
ncbi:hypothetical protein BD779DRAFT_958266 [Infundibulicybe gibba]|nr:hypothetical protein BD779DRAFT_958266 [Infundibulicybe gibba]